MAEDLIFDYNDLLDAMFGYCWGEEDYFEAELEELEPMVADNPQYHTVRELVDNTVEKMEYLKGRPDFNRKSMGNTKLTSDARTTLASTATFSGSSVTPVDRPGQGDDMFSRLICLRVTPLSKLTEQVNRAEPVRAAVQKPSVRPRSG